jgi:hypothetical protein
MSQSEVRGVLASQPSVKKVEVGQVRLSSPVRSDTSEVKKSHLSTH